MHRSAISSATRTVIAMLVATTLLCAQWAGLAHRISHAQLQQVHQYFSATSQADDGGDSNVPHSCAAFDAATVGDTVHIGPFLAPLLASARVLALWAAFVSWDAPLIPWFSSRAPPQP
jgi:hypothetical protein